MKGNLSLFLRLGCVLLLGFVGSSCSSRQEDGSELTVEDLDEVGFPPKEPAEAIESFEVQDGFEMQLIASEPLVTDPVAMVYDKNGRAYVAEMRSYPYTDKSTAKDWEEQTNQQSMGRIRILEDTDGDGTFDKSTIFAEHLSWPTGLGLWKGGVFVLATPHIWYLKDTNGDRKADVRRKVYTGFRKFNVQAVINNLQIGLDHKFYAAGASNGGMIRPAGQPGTDPIDLGISDFRFDPTIPGSFEVISGGARFGNTFDAWYNRFICNIRNPVQHVVLPARYLERNPYLPVRTAIHDVARSGDQIPVYRISPPEPWRAVRAQRWAEAPEYADTPRSELKAGGYWTSSSGITIYRGAAYPEEYRGNVFIGEVANNVVHRQVRSPDGVTFTSVRAAPHVEFVASTDTWFRPVNFVNAPDGTLHVVDMYREIIEHPWSIPDDILAQLDLRSGTDRGRIYRLAPPNFEVPEPPRLGAATTAELVATLENPNGWWRDTAHRLLYERQDLDAVAPLRKLLYESKKPLARVHALWSLKGLEALRDEDIARGLSDPSAGVREQAVRLAEARLHRSPALLSQVLDLVGDPSIRVRFQVAFTLGEVDGPQVLDALAAIAKRDAESRWVRTAVLSAVPRSSSRLLVRLLQDDAFIAKEQARELMQSLAGVVGARNETAEVNRVLTALATPSGDTRTIQKDVVIGLGEGLERAGTSLRAALSAASLPAEELVDSLMAEARQAAQNERLPISRRQQAIQLLAYDDFEQADVQTVLQQLLSPHQPQQVQMAAVRALAEFTHPHVAGLLLEAWDSYTPAVRREVVEALLAREERIAAFLDALEAGAVPTAQISLTTRARLLENEHTAIRSRAKALFKSGASRSREDVIARYTSALSLDGRVEQGREVFKQNCMSCHRVGDRQAGNEVGPNLASIQHKTPKGVLVDILDPNRVVSPDHVRYRVKLKDGQTVTGIIAAEAPSSITLERPGDIQETVLRKNIVQITSSGVSLMPVGLEQQISTQEMADLLQFLLPDNF